jgi:hypothetical protein
MTNGVGSGYLLAGQLSELERLQLQSRVWERPAKRSSNAWARAAAEGRSTSAAAASVGSAS